MDIVTRMFLLFSSWIALVLIIMWFIGPERKKLWFRQRDTTKSFLNRRGFLGDFLHIGYPCTREGLVIWLILIAFIGVTTKLMVSGH